MHKSIELIILFFNFLQMNHPSFVIYLLYYANIRKFNFNLVICILYKILNYSEIEKLK